MPTFITDEEMYEMYGDTPEARNRKKCEWNCGGGGCDACSGGDRD